MYSEIRGRSPVYISSPMTRRVTPINLKVRHSNSPMMIRTASPSPFKQVKGLSSIESATTNDNNIYWKNKYDSLQLIYQLEIEELRKFYSSQSIMNNSSDTNEDIEQLKKDNRILSEFIMKNQEELELKTKENTELQAKLAATDIRVEKIEDLICKNSELNRLMDYKTEETAEFMLKLSQLDNEIALKNEEIYRYKEEIEHLKELVAQLIQDNDKLSEVLEPLKMNNSENYQEIELLKQKSQEIKAEKQALEKDIQALKVVNAELHGQIERMTISLSVNNVDNCDNRGEYYDYKEKEEYEVLFANFNELKEENYKLKQEIQGSYGDVLLMKEREKMMRQEMEKIKKSGSSLTHNKGSSLSIK